MGRFSSSQQSLHLAKSDRTKKILLSVDSQPPSPPSLLFSMVAIYFVPKSLLSFKKKSLAPLITKKTFEMWNEFKPTQHCVLKSLDTCNNSSWMCELSCSHQQSANPQAKLNRGHMVQWLDHYFGICDCSGLVFCWSTELREFERVTWQKVGSVSGDTEPGWCQRVRALHPLSPAPSMLRFAQDHSVLSSDWKSVQNTCKLPGSQSSLTPWMMRGCNIAFIRKTYNKLKAARQQSWTVKGKRDLSSNHSAVTWALIEFLYGILKEEFNDV